MQIAEAPVRDVRPLFAGERAGLLALLASLGDADWAAPTEAGHWTVKDVVLHLLDDDLGWLSRDRDGDTSGLLDASGDYRQFVAALDAKNQRWIDGAYGLSPRVLRDLLAWSGEQVAEYFAVVDMHEPSLVSWASDEPVPRWLDLARDLTERWVHQQHIRDAVGDPGNHGLFLPDVLGTFAWAFPHQYRPQAPPGTIVNLDFGSGGTWHLTREPERWVLGDGDAGPAAAALRMPPELAWRQLTGLPVPARQYATAGASNLVQPLLAVRGIIV